MVAGEYKRLIEYETLLPEALLSIPTPDHYLPMLYVIATRQQGEIITFPIEGVDGGSIQPSEAHSTPWLFSPLKPLMLDRTSPV